MRKSIALLMICVENLKISKYHTFLKKKKSVLSIFCSKNANEVEKVFKEK